MRYSRVLGILVAVIFVMICILLAESSGAPTQAVLNSNMCVQSSCHTTFPLNQNTNLLSVTGFPTTTYTPGQSYDITVTVSKNPNASASSAVAGFAAFVNKDGTPFTASVGTITITDSGTHPMVASIGPGGSIQYVTHNLPRPDPSTANFTFRWTAPSTASGNAVLVVGSNSANGDGTDSGDFITKKTFTATPGQSCAFSISPASQTFPATGGTGSVTVTTATGCAWTAASNASFITITSGASGSGNGTVNFSVDVNTLSAQRTGTVTIAGQTFTVTQAQQAACTYSIAPTSQSFSSTGGTATVTVTTQSGCAWTAASNDSFITVTSGASGSGNGTMSFLVTANTGNASRTGTLTIAGQTFTVTQQGACSFSVAPSSQPFASAGGTGTVTVATASGCAWTATTSASFITITSGANGSGNGTVNFAVGINTGMSSRTGTLTIAGQTFTVTQSAAVPEPEKQNFSQFANGDAGGGSTFSSTVIIANNSSTQTATGTARVFNSDGTPMIVDINGSVINGVFGFVVPPQGIRFFSTGGTGTLQVGSVQLSSTVPVAGTILFVSPLGTTAVPGVQPLAHFMVPIEYDLRDPIKFVKTGVAFSNSTGSTITFTANLRDGDGLLVPNASKAITLGPNSQLARFPDEAALFQNLGTDFFRTFKGTLEIVSPTPLNGMAIRVTFGAGQFTTEPVTAVN